MPISNIYTLREIVLGGASSVYLVQCTQRSIDPGTGLVMNRAAGQPEVSWVSVMDINPVTGFSSTEITRMLANINYQTGCAIGAGLTYTSCDLYFEKMKDLGTRTGGSNMMKIATTRGLFTPGELSVRQGGEASMSATYYNTTTDGTTAPWTISTGQAASAATMTVDQKYTLGKCTINGTQINGVEGWTASFGADHKAIGADGGPYPQFCGIMTNNPVLKIQTNDPVNLSTYGLEGTAIISSTDLYMTALAANGTRVPNGTTSHIRIRVSTGLATVGAVSGNNNDAAGCELTLTPTKQSGTFLTVSTGVAIA